MVKAQVKRAPKARHTYWVKLPDHPKRIRVTDSTSGFNASMTALAKHHEPVGTLVKAFPSKKSTHAEGHYRLKYTGAASNSPFGKKLVTARSSPSKKKNGGSSPSPKKKSPSPHKGSSPRRSPRKSSPLKFYD
jgi:hypothetical protein